MPGTSPEPRQRVYLAAAGTPATSEVMGAWDPWHPVGFTPLDPSHDYGIIDTMTTTNDTKPVFTQDSHALFFEIETHTADGKLHEIDSYIVLAPTESVERVTIWNRSRRTRDHRTRWERSGITSNDARSAGETNEQGVNRLLATVATAKRYAPDGELGSGDVSFKQKLVHLCVVGMTDAEHKESRTQDKTPYPVLDRVKRVLRSRGDAL